MDRHDLSRPRPGAADVLAGPPFLIASHVGSLTTPVGLSPLSRWIALTAALVAGPNLPSVRRAAPRVFNCFCRPSTAAPVSPFFNVGDTAFLIADAAPESRSPTPPITSPM